MNRTRSFPRPHRMRQRTVLLRVRVLLSIVALAVTALIAAPSAATAAAATAGPATVDPATTGRLDTTGRPDTTDPSVKAHATQLKKGHSRDRCVSRATAAEPTQLCLHHKAGGAAALTTKAKAARRDALQAHPSATVRASADGSVAPAAASPPAQCRFGSFSGANQPDRFTSCTDGYWEYYLYIPRTGQVVGWVDFEDLQYITLDARSLVWKHGFILVVYDGQGLLKEGTGVTMSTGCILNPGVCRNGARPFGADAGGTAWNAAPYTNWSSEWDEYDSGAVTTTARSVDFLDDSLGVEITIVGSPNPLAWNDIGQGLVARCDNTLSTSTSSSVGCVNDDVVPTLTYDSTRNPLVAPVAQHIYTAQTAATSAGGLATKWGVPPIALYRDTRQSDIDASRRVSCGSVSTPAGSNCDEFPMASTYEGAAFQSDYSVAVVPESANSSQGGLTSGFYSGNRVIDTDPFYVQAILPGGASSW